MEATPTSERIEIGAHYNEKNTLGKEESAVKTVRAYRFCLWAAPCDFKKYFSLLFRKPIYATITLEVIMKEFLTGLLVIVMALLLMGAGILLLPLLLVLGIFLRLAVGLILFLLAIWLIGKVTLFLIASLGKKENKQA